MQRYRVEINNHETIRWYKEGTNILHREKGPAIECTNGNKAWYKEGLCHRDDGPAEEFGNGDKFWFLEGKKYSESEFLKKTQLNTCSGKIIKIDGKDYKLTAIN